MPKHKAKVAVAIVAFCALIAYTNRKKTRLPHIDNGDVKIGVNKQFAKQLQFLVPICIPGTLVQFIIGW